MPTSAAHSPAQIPPFYHAPPPPPPRHTSLPGAVLEERVAANQIDSAGFLPSEEVLAIEGSLVQCRGFRKHHKVKKIL